jgi:glutathione S-transferase
MTIATYLTYFDVRGRAEPIRLILEEMGEPYEERRVSLVEWPDLKPRTPFGKLPLLERDGIVVAESQAICRHLARVHDLYGRTELERTRCDTTEGALLDAKQLLGMYFWRRDYEAHRERFVETELQGVLVGLEGFFRANGRSDFWVGDSLTFVDLVALSFLDDVDALFPEALVRVPLLGSFRDGISGRPRIARYLNSSRRPDAIQYIQGDRLLHDPRKSRAA